MCPHEPPIPYPVLHVPYDRPTQLSDPYCDFEGCDLDGTLACPDTQMAWHEYSYIFQGCLPAGTYEECAYFIPYALKYMATPEGEVTLIDNFLRWVSQNMQELKEDSLYDGVMEYMHAIFLNALSNFDVTSDRDACRHLTMDHADSIVDGLVGNEAFGNTVEEWLQDWFGEGVDTYEKAACILHFVDHQLFMFRGSKYPQTIRAWSEDGDLIQACCGIVSDRALTSDDPALLDYWDRELRWVGWIGSP